MAPTVVVTRPQGHMDFRMSNIFLRYDPQLSDGGKFGPTILLWGAKM